MTARLLRAIRLRKACWRADDRDDMQALRKTLAVLSVVEADLNAEEAAAYREFIYANRVAAAILERGLGDGKLQ